MFFKIIILEILVLYIYKAGVSSLSDIDIALLAGTGLPQDKGGPLHYADVQGLDNILKEMENFSSVFGQRFWLLPSSKDMCPPDGWELRLKKGFLIIYEYSAAKTPSHKGITI